MGVDRSQDLLQLLLGVSCWLEDRHHAQQMNEGASRPDESSNVTVVEQACLVEGGPGGPGCPNPAGRPRRGPRGPRPGPAGAAADLKWGEPPEDSLTARQQEGYRVVCKASDRPTCRARGRHLDRAGMLRPRRCHERCRPDCSVRPGRTPGEPWREPRGEHGSLRRVLRTPGRTGGAGSLDGHVR